MFIEEEKGFVGAKYILKMVGMYDKKSCGFENITKSFYTPQVKFVFSWKRMARLERHYSYYILYAK